MKLYDAKGNLVATLTLERGSAATPSLRFDGDPDTGLFWSAADSVGLATGGVERLVLNERGQAAVRNRFALEQQTVQVDGDVLTADWEKSCVKLVAATGFESPFTLCAIEAPTDTGPFCPLMFVLNRTNQDMTLKHEDPVHGGTHDRFSLPQAEDVVIADGETAIILYDADMVRWRLVSRPASLAPAPPPGVLSGWAGAISAVPAGWLFCNGSAVSRTTFSALFAAIGTVWGVGDGSTTFNLPDSRDRFPVGANTDVSGVPTTSANTLAGNTQCGDLSCHTHGFTTDGHCHGYDGTTGAPNECATAVACYIAGSPACVAADGHTHNFSGGTSCDTDGGTTDGFQTLPPYFATPMIIKT